MLDQLAASVPWSSFAWFGLGGTSIAGLAALAWFFPPLRKIAVVAMAAIGGALVIRQKGYKDGSSQKQKEWDAAERRAVDRSKDARAGARSDVARGVPDPWHLDRNDK